MATIHNCATIQINATLKLKSNKAKIHLVWNRSLYVQGYSPTIHPTTSNSLSSISTFDVQSGSSATQHSNNIKTLITVHGTLNALSWGILLPVGVVTACYLRYIQSLGLHDSMLMQGCNSLLIFGTIGFAIGAHLGQLSLGGQYGLHQKLGFTVFFLGVLRILALLFRPKTTNKFRKYWKSYHHAVGYGCVVLGLMNVFQGFEVMGASRSYAKLCYCLGLSTLIGISISLEVNSWVVFCWKSKEEKMRRDGLIGTSEKGSSGIQS